MDITVCGKFSHSLIFPHRIDNECGRGKAHVNLLPESEDVTSPWQFLKPHSEREVILPIPFSSLSIHVAGRRTRP
jgi:hypothetical protein